MNEINLTVHPFEMGVLKEAVLKPLEEASEVHGAWQRLGETEDGEFARMVKAKDISLNDRLLLAHLADEIADCIQACCNLSVRYDLDIAAAMERCERRNVERGRYEGQASDVAKMTDSTEDNAGSGDEMPQSLAGLTFKDMMDVCKGHVAILSSVGKADDVIDFAGDVTEKVFETVNSHVSDNCGYNAALLMIATAIISEMFSVFESVADKMGIDYMEQLRILAETNK